MSKIHQTGSPPVEYALLNDSAFPVVPGQRAPKPWYVVTTKPSKEAIAILNLKLQNFEVFFPKVRMSANRASPAPAALKPLFPGYVFVSFCLAHNRWQAINGTFGVGRLLCAHGSTPAPIASSIMDDLLAHCPENTWQPEPAGWCKGDKVAVKAGPFQGALAHFDKMLSRDRVSVLLSWINDEVPVIMHSGLICRA